MRRAARIVSAQAEQIERCAKPPALKAGGLSFRPFVSENRFS